MSWRRRRWRHAWFGQPLFSHESLLLKLENTFGDCGVLGLERTPHGLRRRPGPLGGGLLGGGDLLVRVLLGGGISHVFIGQDLLRAAGSSSPNDIINKIPIPSTTLPLACARGPKERGPKLRTESARAASPAAFFMNLAIRFSDSCFRTSMAEDSGIDSTKQERVRGMRMWGSCACL